MRDPRVLAGTVLLVSVTACGGQAPARPASPPSTPAVTASSVPSTSPSTDKAGPRKSDISWNGQGDPYNAEVTLDDGRRVAMHYRRGKGLFEQHYGPEIGWSEPRLVYGTKTEACQGVELRAFGATVAAIADFGLYCSDGEPPMESIAAVGVGDLSTWAHHLTRSFDGWQRVSAGDGGEVVTFRNGSTKLRWSRAGGFSE
ncbi:hypothetical protein [Nonomuraea sp. NPDC050643]|uniref:hypothetical protein n=1 Tax=Nonomuraea sp. NPDC050643 TaxID=3155660 RepID=UPI0033F94309